MSYFKPDYDYDPLDRSAIPNNLAEKLNISDINIARENLHYAINDLLRSIPDANLVHFSKATNLTFRTNVNVFDSASFFRKFCDSYFFSFKKTFPHLKESELEELRNSFETIEKLIDKFSKEGNVENKFLLPLLLGALAGILNYENY
jgi:hypothetical protein